MAGTDPIALIKQNGGFVTEEKLLKRGIDLQDDGLIFIQGHGAPAFQFDQRNNHFVVQIIALVNVQLRKVMDPLQLAAWWLTADNRGKTPSYYAQGQFEKLWDLARRAQGKP